MCTVPSWITVKDGKKSVVLFLTDKDAASKKMQFVDSTGHEGIRHFFGSVYGNKKEGEGLHDKTPKVVRDAILAGKMNKIAAVGEVEISEGRWVLPFTKVSDITAIGKAVVILPRLTECNDISVGSKASFKAPALLSFDEVSLGDGCSFQIGHSIK